MDYIVHKAIELDALSNKAKQALSTNRDWIISPKYDGCHVVFAFDNGTFLGAYSRSGESVKSMNHVAEELRRMYYLHTGRIAICGEAWAFGKEFNEISGMFRRQRPQPELEFVPFDMVPFDYNDQTTSGPLLLGQLDQLLCNVPYGLRLGQLIAGRKEGWSKSCYLPVAVTLNCSLDEAVEKATALAKEYKKRKDSFYDGVVLAPASGKYVVGAGKGGEFIKIKPLVSFTVTVTGAETAKGAKTGKNTAALTFVLDGHNQKVSTGLVQSQVDDICKEFMTRAYGGTKGEWLGAHIEVEAMGFTVNGLLREPRFKGIRYDA